MEEMKVKIHGHKLSSYCTMVQCALKLKGVPYEFIEEDLINKSQTLIQLNPVYHKVPVLVVDGKPISESLVILEYIDELWNEKYLPLLPKDPYIRARIRFWAGFIYQKLVPNCLATMATFGEEQDKAVRELIEYLNTLEEGLKKEFASSGGSSPFVHGEKPGLLDLVIGSLSTVFKVLGKVAGVELLKKERTPFLWSCTVAFLDLDIAKELIVPHDELLGDITAKREKARLTVRA